MKNPQLENGYLKIANEIVDALMKYHLSGNEWCVLLCVLRKTWGWNKKEDAISITQFSIATGISRPRVSAAIKKLVAKSVLVAKSGTYIHVYSLNKLYSQWNVPQKRASSILRTRVVAKSGTKLVAKSGHTKDNKYTITKDKGDNTPYSTPNALEENDLLDIATKYHVPIAFVKSKYDDMVLWAGQQPNRKKTKNRNWKLTLMRWVKDDAIKIAAGQKRGGVFDARKII